MVREVPALRLLALAVALAACSGGPRVLRHVPDDTLFVIASIEPVPAAVIDQRLRPVDQALRALMGLVGNLEVEAGEPDALLFTLLRELKGKINHQGLRTLGLDVSQPWVVYGNGALPVLWMALSDEARFRGFLERLAKRAGPSLKTGRRGAFEYWRLDGAFTGLVAIGGAEVMVTVAPAAQVDEVLGQLLDGEVESPLPVAHLDDLGDRYGLQSPLGYIDLPGMVQAMLGRGAPLLRQLRGLGVDIEPIIPSACQKTLARYAPNLVVGGRAAAPGSSTLAVIAEIDAALGKRLATVTSNIPGFGTGYDPETVFALGLGLDVGHAVAQLEVLDEYLQRQGCQPAGLANLGRNLGQAGFARELAKITGLSVAVEGVTGEGGDLPQIQAYGLLRHEDPDALLDLLRRIPFAPLPRTIPEDGTPVAIPLPFSVPWLRDPVIARRGKLIGVAMGAGMADKLRKRITAPEIATPTVAFVYSESKLLKLADRFPVLRPLIPERTRIPEADAPPDGLRDVEKLLAVDYVVEVGVRAEAIEMQYHERSAPRGAR